MSEVRNDNSRKLRRFFAVALAGLLISGAAFGLGWAVRELASPMSDAENDANKPRSRIAITEGEVGSSLTLGATAEWTRAALTTGHPSGVLTTAPTEPTSVPEGGTLFTVNLRPIVLGNGSIPMYRDIAAGAHGEDVTQLQEMLSRLGYYEGTANGDADSLTRWAVIAWQNDLGVEADGVVRKGDIVFTNTAPVTVILHAERGVGDTLTGSEPVIEVVAPEPRVLLSLTDAQRSLVMEGMRVTAAKPEGGTWGGRVGPTIDTDQPGSITASLLNEDGGPLCGTECDQVRSGGTILTTIYQIEPVSGLTIPVTAIRTDSAGRTSVVREDGEPVAVEVLATAHGIAAISGDGLKAGVSIVIGAPGG